MLNEKKTDPQSHHSLDMDMWRNSMTPWRDYNDIYIFEVILYTEKFVSNPRQNLSDDVQTIQAW